MTIETGLNAIVTPHCTNIYPGIAPKGYKLPCVVFNRLDTMPINNFDGTGGAWISLQIDAYAARYLDARALADALRPDLLNWRDATVKQVSWSAEHEDIDTTTGQDIYSVKARYLLLTKSD